MTSNSDQIVHQVTHDFQSLVEYITGPDAGGHTAYTMELTLFRRLLALGLHLLRLFFVTQAAARPTDVSPAADGTPRTYHDRRPITYYSVFGKVRFARHYFSAAGQGGVCPLDARLSLPDHCYSDLLREWASYASTDAAYAESQTLLARLLGLNLSVAAIEQGTVEAAADVTAFYDHLEAPSSAPTEATLLVVSADGKGVPMVQPCSRVGGARLGKGQKRTTKKEAVVVGVYTIAPYARTPAAIVAALLRQDRPSDAPRRPAPVGKEVQATLDGKAAALTRLQRRVAVREGDHIQHRVALTDGAEALQQQVQTHFPDFTLVLDIYHASEYLWAAANALLGETHPTRLAWMQRHLDLLVGGQTEALLTALETAGQAADASATQRQVVQRAVNYYRRNAPYMHYHVYLTHGWPIGSGVVEAACGHLVKDRLDQSGMRWTPGGAQTVLDLRAVRVNGHWDAYWLFHRTQQQRRLYGSAVPAPLAVEAQLLDRAA